MTVTKASTQVTWPTAANSKSVAASGSETSEAFTFNAAAFQAMITCKADNSGTPAAGDTVEFYLLYTTGDPDGASTDEYDTDEHGHRLCVLDTNTEDPAQSTVLIPTSAKGGKIRAVNNGASAVTVSAEIYESRG